MMDAQGFLLWFDGFCQAIDTQPNEKQWAKLLAKRAEVDMNSSTDPQLVDRGRNSYFAAPAIDTSKLTINERTAELWRGGLLEELLRRGMDAGQAEAAANIEPVNLSLDAARAADSIYSVE